jgi:3',5'-cyclic AMP phosphodiesterase CpdA
MRTLVHLSDLHFGSIRDELVGPLLTAVGEIKPDVTAISGDLTQRARQRQFTAARAFVDALPGTKIIVPGNHDVPLYNVLARFRKLQKYRRYITHDLEPFYCDTELAVLGLNTARALTFKSGRINEQQIRRAEARLWGLPRAVTKMVVTHHPLDLPESYRRRKLVGRARMAIERLNRCHIDVYLAGHFHVGGAEPTSFRIPIGGYWSIVVQSGTATSSRTRNDQNSFNVIHVMPPELSIERFSWEPRHAGFVITHRENFRRGDSGWARI